MGVCVAISPKWLMPHRCQFPWIKAQSLNFTHILSVSFQLQCGGVHRTRAKTISLFLYLYLKLYGHFLPCYHIIL